MKSWVNLLNGCLCKSADVKKFCTVTPWKVLALKERFLVCES